MKEKSLEEYLRENKPVVPDDPTFILETQRRMAEVDGIKEEVDRQRRRGRTALIITLIAGIALGALATALAFLYPVNPARITGTGLWENFRVFLDTWKYYLMFPVAACAVALSLVLTLGRRNAIGW